MKRVVFWLAFFIASCGYERGEFQEVGDIIDNSPDTGSQPGADVSDFALSLSGTPQIRYDATNGKTTLIVQFTVRDQTGRPLETHEFDWQMFIDESPLDAESLLQADSIDLESSVFYTMVLDASYSMLEHSPPAFDPMLAAAKDSIETLENLWSSQPGTLEFETLWFNEQLFRQTGDWRSNDILSIPAPNAGTATKLYSAIEFMAHRMRNAHSAGIANGERDSHVMVVFTDGADNYSFFDNSGATAQQNTSSGATFETFGWPATDLQNAKSAIAQHPNLRVHVIGLGSAVESAALAQISEVGDGLLLQNPDSNEIDTVFERVTQEFTTLQTRGATVPLPPGEYGFKLRVQVGGVGTEEITFRFETGVSDTGIID